MSGARAFVFASLRRRGVVTLRAKDGCLPGARGVQAGQQLSLGLGLFRHRGLDRRFPMTASHTERTPAHALHGPVRLLMQSDLTTGARQRLALRDVVGALELWRLSLTLGWFDIRLRYRGSILGPFWLTLSTGVMVAALGILY